MKDKIKPIKKIDDDTNIAHHKESDLTQCSRCLKLSHISESHKCDTNWFHCSICGIDLHKKDGKIYRFAYKKYIKVINSMICYPCAYKIAREIK